MSMNGSIIELQNETARQAALDRAKAIAESSQNGGRNVGGDMGKSDFLMLLAAQLRYQDPLEPSSDADFSAQLAQFSSLEQMQNVNTTLEQMSGYQAYSLVGKFVMAETVIAGKFESVAGVVSSVFTENGILKAQIGEFVVPVSAISEVFDTNDILTSEMFMQTSSQLIGRAVVAEIDGEEIEGIVTRVVIDRGAMFAQIDDGSEEPKFVPVNHIIDIREPGTDRFRPKPNTPPDAVNFKPIPDSEGYYEVDADDLVTVIGRWDWDADAWEWKYTELTGGTP